MELLLNIFYIVAGVVGLYYGAEFLIKGGVAIARKARISPLVIGLTLVACATSAPELVVSVSAALDGNSNISLGNVVGSNICNIALILGLSALIRPLSVKKQLLTLDSPVMVASSLLLALFYFFNHGLNRIQGALLLAGLIAYTLWNIHISRRDTALAAAAAPEGEISQNTPDMPLYKALLWLVIALAALVGGARIFLNSAIYFARLMNISDAVIGLTVVAVGTSLPELAASVVAAIRNESDIAIGNVVGSNIFNILGILGVAPLINPMDNAALNTVDLSMMIFCAVILIPMMRTKWKISRLEGTVLLLSYSGYIFYLICGHS